MASSTPTFSARPITRKTASSFRRDLLPSSKRNSETFERTVEQGNFQYLMAVGERYRLEGGKWNAASRFLFRCLIDALDLAAHESLIQGAVTPKRGRRKNTDLAERISYEKEKGNSISQIEKTLKSGGMNQDLTREAIKDYLKPRRREHKPPKP
jgi:hypothetical protein